MATLSQMGVPGGGNILLHPKQKYRWQIRFIGLAGVPTRELTAQCISANRPNVEYETVTLHRYNGSAYILGKRQPFAPLNVHFEDDITGIVSGYLAQQSELQQRLIGADSSNSQWLNTAPTADSYKFLTYLELLDGNEGVVETWVMEGCSLSALDNGDLDYASSDVVTISATIHFDHAYQILSGQGYGTALGGLST
jgi:hypothetical protein